MGRPRSTRREDPSLDQLVAVEVVNGFAKPTTEKVQIGPVKGSWRADQEAWVKATNRWGR